MIVPLPCEDARRTSTVGRKVQSSEVIDDPDALTLREGPSRRRGTPGRDRVPRRSPRARPGNGPAPPSPRTRYPPRGRRPATPPPSCARIEIPGHVPRRASPPPRTPSRPDSPPLLVHDRSRPPARRPAVASDPPHRFAFSYAPGGPAGFNPCFIVTICGRPFKPPPPGGPAPGVRPSPPLAPPTAEMLQSSADAERTGRGDPLDDGGGQIRAPRVSPTRRIPDDASPCLHSKDDLHGIVESNELYVSCTAGLATLLSAPPRRCSLGGGAACALADDERPPRR